MQLCEECGAEVPDDAQFCGHCGRNIQIENDIASSTAVDSVEDKLLQSSEVSTMLHDSQGFAPEVENEDELQVAAFPLEHSADNEESISHLTAEHESEEPSIDLLEETSQEEQDHYPISADENEEPIHHEQNEPATTIPVDMASEPEILTNPMPADQSVPIQTQKSYHETQNPNAPAQKPGSQPASKCLLFSFVGLIALIGIVAALVSLFHQNLPVIGGNSNVLSSSSNNEISDSSGSSLTASVCINASTPSSSATNQGSNFTLTSSTGCSNVVASKADATCLSFQSNGTNAHKYIVDVSNAAIGNSFYHLVLSVVNYTVPALYNDAKQLSIGLSEGSTGRNFIWFYRSGSVSVNHDELSGSMDVILAPEKDGNTLHVVGDWACGRQIKSS